MLLLLVLLLLLRSFVLTLALFFFARTLLARSGVTTKWRRNQS